MDITIRQIQNRSLLEEHAKSSFNFSFLRKNELFISIGFLIVGIVISIIFQPKWFVGLPFIIIGLFEIIKYPTREQRWVSKKQKESIFGQNLEFRLRADSLTILYDQQSKAYRYDIIRECLISETGILFKISWTEYYYISFNSLGNQTNKQEVIDFLRERFEQKKLKIKRLPK